MEGIDLGKTLVGKRFGRLIVTGLLYRTQSWQWRVMVLCDCGKKKNMLEKHLSQRRVVSCGCYLKERIPKIFSKHGDIGKNKPTRTYVSFANMLQRCRNKMNPGYRYYGLRGIEVCERWLDYRNFKKDMGERPLGKSIDRIDNNGNYEPGNCRWATAKEQSQNKRRRTNYRIKN